MSFKIEQIKPDSMPVMRELIRCFAVVFDEHDTYLANQASDEYLVKLLNDSTFIAVCATVDKSVVGGLVAYELKKFEQPRSEIYIYDLAVTQPYRRQGIATALIDQVKKIALERQAWVVYVQADKGDEPATKLYSKLGVREDVLHFDISPNTANS